MDYSNRIYDPRTGRFLSVDPVTAHYPELTPYQFASNRPIDGIDIDGLEYGSAFIETVKMFTVQQKVREPDPVMAEKMLNNSAKFNGMAAFIVVNAALTGGKLSQFLFVYLPLASLPEHNAARSSEGKIAQRAREKENFRNSVLGLGFNYIFNRLARGMFGSRATPEEIPEKDYFDIWEIRRNTDSYNGKVWYSYKGERFAFYKNSPQKGLELELNIDPEHRGIGLGSFLFRVGVKATNATKFTATWVKSSIY